MKQWKIIAIASFSVNLILMGLLIVALFYMISTLNNKNEEIEALQQVAEAPYDLAAQKAIEEKETATLERRSSAEQLQREFQVLKNTVEQLLAEETLLASTDDTVVMRYEEAHIQATAYMNRVYDTLNRELSGREKSSLRLEQKGWLQNLKAMQAKYVNESTESAQLQAVKEAYTSTMKRNQELLERYFTN